MEVDRQSQALDTTSLAGRLSEADRLTLAGAVAALVTLAVAFLIRGLFDMPTLPELIASTLLRFMPIELFSFGLQVFGGWAKPVLLGGAVLGIVSLGSAIARFDGRTFADMQPGRRLRATLKLALVIWAPLALFGLVASGIGVIFLATNRETVQLLASLLVSALVYAVALHWGIGFVAAQVRAARGPAVDRPPRSLSRRRLLGQAAAGVAGLASLAYLGRIVVATRAGVGGERTGEISAPVTPVGEFYTVSKNFVNPSVGLDGWSLSVGGMTQRTIELSYDELRALPAVEQHATLTCISNPVGGNLIDNAAWTGVRLADILELAGVEGEPARVVFYGADGYSDSFEIEKAFEPTTIVAYLMNGAPLEDKHGFPARLIVPGKYGIKNGKWLERIELVRGNYEGYWQARGWTNTADIKTMSTFERPLDRAVLNLEPQEIGGVAFAGPRGISRVEYSLDGGETWQDADELLNPGPLSWTIWRATWTPAGSGAYRLVVRATDGEGNLQSDAHADPLPDGASGYHRLVVGVA